MGAGDERFDDDLAAFEEAGTQGRWQGITSQARPVTFEVGPAGLASFALGWETDACTWSTVLTFDTPAPVSAQEGVDLELEVSGGVLAVELRFPFPGIATGEIAFTPNEEREARCPDEGRTSFVAYPRAE
jgi:hypothetical protein